MIKLGIVGTGKIVQEILPVLSGMDRIQIQALCGTERSKDLVARLAETYGIPQALTDFDRLLALDDLDAIYIAVPNNIHFELARKALQKGRNVFLEKPFTLTYGDACQLAELAKAKGCLVLEAISNQYLPIYDQVKKALPLLGQIKLVEMNFSQYSSRFDRFVAGETFPVFDPKAGGGALYDINIYNLHLAVGLFGLPKTYSYQRNLMRGVDTSGIVTLNYDDFICTCLGAKDCQGPNQVLIQGTGGYLRIQAPSNTLQAPLEFYDTKSKEVRILYEPDLKLHRMTYEFEALDRILTENNQKEWEGRLKETLDVCNLVEHIYESTGI